MVMVIDDDALTLEYFRRLFRRSDVPVRTFIDAEEAITAFVDQPPRILFVDSRMPLIDGIDVIERLHAAQSLERTYTYLCSAARPPADIYARAEAIGVPVLLKETQSDKAFLSMLVKRAEQGAPRDDPQSLTA